MTKPARILILYRPVPTRGRAPGLWRRPPMALEIGGPAQQAAVMEVNQWGAQKRVSSGVTYAIADPGIASIALQPDGSCVVTPIKSGTTTLTARYADKTDTATVEVVFGIPTSIRIVWLGSPEA